MILNAAIMDQDGPHLTSDKKYELTFFVNVLAPFIITSKILDHSE
jgi:hypothetical protein